MKSVSTILLCASLFLLQVNCFNVTRGIYERCGGLYDAPAGVLSADQQWADCQTGTKCKNQGNSYWQCIADESAPGLKNWQSCDPANNKCAAGMVCSTQNGGTWYMCQFPAVGASSNFQPQTKLNLSLLLTNATSDAEVAILKAAQVALAMVKAGANSSALERPAEVASDKVAPAKIPIIDEAASSEVNKPAAAAVSTNVTPSAVVTPIPTEGVRPAVDVTPAKLPIIDEFSASELLNPVEVSAANATTRERGIPPPPPPKPTDVTPATALGPLLSGTTTSYWDCCKPSCAWPGKSPLVNSPVRACRVDGTPATLNEETGCAGGTAFACGNQTPWEINSDLAYGFAAKGYDNDQTKDNCCACFELTFTNTALKGKRMIVQATNTGIELEEGHFDVALPGGGQGLYSGCSVQFKGKKFGRQFGGMLSVDECIAFPEGGELRKGCEFRFGWFANADNPKIEYRKVVCPAELVAITGCKQS